MRIRFSKIHAVRRSQSEPRYRLSPSPLRLDDLVPLVDVFIRYHAKSTSPEPPLIMTSFPSFFLSPHTARCALHSCVNGSAIPRTVLTFPQVAQHAPILEKRDAFSDSGLSSASWIWLPEPKLITSAPSGNVAFIKTLATPTGKTASSAQIAITVDNKSVPQFYPFPSYLEKFQLYPVV